MKKIKRLLIVSSDKHLTDVLRFCFDGWGYEVFSEESKINDIAVIKRIAPDAIVVDVHSASKSHLEICRLIKNDFITSLIPVITLINKRQLREQLLTLKHGIDDYLIKPPDPLDLRTRIEIAIRRYQHSFYSSPLTGLPGSRLIEDVVREKIEADTSFTFGHIDIDNFKYFNDVYGYVKGDRVLMQTAYLLYSVIKKFSSEDDFIGHIGGDDFVFVTAPERYKEICQNFIFLFDNIIPFHYSLKDREQGFVVARDRLRQIKKMPLMSVTVALVNKTQPHEFKNIIEINERAAEVKKYLKTVPGSKFMADRRNINPPDALDLQVYKKDDIFIQQYKPLGQILLDKHMLSQEQLDEALMINWKRGVALGEILKELGLVKEDQLLDALSSQQSNLIRATEPR
ncbi:MAG: diguanylate cyclase [Candidatus Omnitrophota bacterium]